MKKIVRKFLSLLLTVTMLCGLFVPSAAADEISYSDISGHWAEEAIARWSANGVVNGYDDGRFGPDDSLTRAQTATILSNTLGLSEAAENTFADVSAEDWFAPYILRCAAAGILSGDGVNANPDAVITRQEAMTMLCRAFAIAPIEGAALEFTDGADTAAWAVPYVAALVDSGIVGGVGEGLLAPEGTMSRASMVTVIDRAVVQYITEAGKYELTGGEGIVLVAAGDVTLSGTTAADILVTPAADGKAVTFTNANVSGEITVQADNATVTNNNSKLPEIALTGEGSEVKKPTVVSGGGGGGGSRYSNLTIEESKTVSAGTYQNVTITDAVGDGEVTLENLTIRGDLTVNGGGSSTVKLVNCTLFGKVIMDKAEGETPRLLLTNTPVSTVEVKAPAILEAADAASAVTMVEAKAALEIKGENTAIAAVIVPSELEAPVAVTVTGGAVDTVEAKSETTVSGAAGSVGEVVAKAVVSLDSAAVSKVEVPASAPAGIAITVTGTDSVEIAVNSENGAAIFSDTADIDISTELEEIPAIELNGGAVHVHQYDDGEVTTAPTCEGKGVKTYSCVAAGCEEPAASYTETVPALGHAYGDWTQLDNDKHQRVCANDETHILSDDHTWDSGAQTTAPTCEEDGVKTYTCSVCSGTKTEGIAAIGHNYGAWSYLNETEHQRVCANDRRHVEEDDHAWDNGVVTREPTAYAAGIRTYTCSACRGTKTETIPALGAQEVAAAKGIDSMVQMGEYIGITMDAPDDLTNIGYFELSFYDSTQKEASLQSRITCQKDGNLFYANRSKFSTAFNYDKVQIVSMPENGAQAATWTGDVSVAHTEKTHSATYTFDANNNNVTVNFDTASVGFYHIAVWNNGVEIPNDSGYADSRADGMSVINTVTAEGAAAILAGTAEIRVAGWNVTKLEQTGNGWDIAFTVYPEVIATYTESAPDVPATKTGLLPTNIHLENTSYGGLTLLMDPPQDTSLIQNGTISYAYNFNNGENSYTRNVNATVMSSAFLTNYDVLNIGANTVELTLTATPTEAAAAAGYGVETKTFTATINYAEETVEYNLPSVKAIFGPGSESGKKCLTVMGLKPNQSYKVAVMVSSTGTVNHREFVTDASGTGTSEWYTSYAFDCCTINEWEVSNVTNTSGSIVSRAYNGIVALGIVEEELPTDLTADITFTYESGNPHMSWVTGAAPGGNAYTIQVSEDGQTWLSLNTLAGDKLVAEGKWYFLQEKLEPGNYTKLRTVLFGTEEVWFTADIDLRVGSGTGSVECTVTPTDTAETYNFAMSGLAYDANKNSMISLSIKDGSTGEINWTYWNKITATTYDNKISGNGFVDGNSYRIRQWNDIVCSGNAMSFTILEDEWTLINA